jgi:hypothetical protein
MNSGEQTSRKGIFCKDALSEFQVTQLLFKQYTITAPHAYARALTIQSGHYSANYQLA